MLEPPRRPRFLSGVPAVPVATPARFADAGRRPPPAAPAPSAAAATPPAPSREALEAERAAEREEARREALARVAGAVETLRAQSERLAEEARADAIEIGFQVARKILEAELRAGPDALFALVRSAVKRAGESRRVAVRVAPEDAELLRSEAGKDALDGLAAARVEWVADPSLQRGDCVVDTDFGQVDGRLTTRLAELRRAADAAREGAA
jgi:flagellar biosynthesis/type III secretory pathway protein FliH